MKINTYNNENVIELYSGSLYAQGVVSIHTDGQPNIFPNAITFSAVDCSDDPYHSVSGETFNVMYSELTPLLFILQPQTNQDIMLPIPRSILTDGEALYTKTGGRAGVIVHMWHESNLQLVEFT